MLTRDGHILMCTLRAVIETADFLGGMYKVWDQSEMLSCRYEDRQTGGGAIRMTWRDGVCWLSRHGGYQVDRTGEAWEVLTVLFDAKPIDRRAYDPNMTDFAGQGGNKNDKFVVLHDRYLTQVKNDRR